MNNVNNINPYRQGHYRQIFDYIMKKRSVTRVELLKYTVDCFGVEKDKDVTVLLSPRLSSKRGDCRGNISCRGDLYYMKKLPRQIRLGIKDPQKFQLMWRDKPLERRLREQIVTRAEKVATKIRVKTKRVRVKVRA